MSADSADNIADVEACEGCGFVWETVAREEIGRRTVVGAHAIAEILRAEPSFALQRPTPERWSMVEYAAHARDVLLTLRDRIVIGLAEDDPGFKPMYRDERVEFGLYRTDTAAAVAPEIEASATMFVRLFDAVDPALLDRPVQYGYPDPTTRSLLWMGQQVVHEIEHHLADVEEDLRLVSSVG